ncbi:MAG: hypothetical protein GY953_12820, partial [bacterium]|nr:hypothetical protein [bacterium]
PENEAVLVSSVGVHPKDLEFTSHAKGLSADFTVAAQLTDASGLAVEGFQEERAAKVFPKAGIEQAQNDPQMRIEHREAARLEPGKKQWRVVLRDERTGAVGVYRTSLDVPDYTQPSTASTLLLTRRAGPPQQPTKDDPYAALLEAAGRQFQTDCSRVFRAGETVVAMYDVYNVSEATLSTPPELALTLVHGGERIPIPPQAGRPFPEAATKTVRYVGALATATLDPGQYTLEAELSDDAGTISESFEVVAQ